MGVNSKIWGIRVYPNVNSQLSTDLTAKEVRWIKTDIDKLVFVHKHYS